MKKITLLGGILVISVVIVLYASVGATTNAGTVASFTPAPMITVEMWQLDDEGHATAMHCSQDAGAKYRWGCTAYCNNSSNCPQTTYVAYPFSGENATVDIEGTGCAPGSSPYNCYLRDVVPVEVAIKVSSRNNKPLAVVEAQAIAARTYTYHRTWSRDNSTNYHVFVPYYFDSLTTLQQGRVNEAMARVYYMSDYWAFNDQPIAAYYGADNDATTTAGSEPYLVSVEDRISAAHGADVGAGYGGMSQRGASRWAFGHTSSWGPAPVGHPNYPRDTYLSGYGNFWSVQYADSFHILTHYYTGVEVRDLAHNHTVVTPHQRFNILAASVNGGPLEVQDYVGITRVAPAAVYQLTAVLQNTGTAAWSVAEYAVGYCWESQCTVAGALPAVMAPGSPSSIAPGKAVTVTLNSSLPGGAGCLSLDLYYQTGWSCGWLGAGILGEPGWPRQPLERIIVTACQKVRLPLVNRGSL
jgi:hypothetical protein